MKFLENGWKKLFTYFIKECIPVPKNEEGSQDQLIVKQDFLYAVLRKLTKKNRTKFNMETIFTGSKTEIMELIQKLKLKMDCNNIDWSYLEQAQEAIRNQMVMNYEAKKEILWEKFDQKHNQHDRQHMRVQVRYTIVEKRLNWKEEGQERFNMNRIQNNYVIEQSTALGLNSSSSSSSVFLIHANTEQTGFTTQQNNLSDYLTQNLVSLSNYLQLPILLDSSMKLALENECLSLWNPNQSLYCDEEEI